MRPQDAWALIKQVQGMVKEGWYPHYTSTYCIHELHDECRLACKTCDAPCLCHCHGLCPDCLGRGCARCAQIDGQEGT